MGQDGTELGPPELEQWAVRQSHAFSVVEISLMGQSLPACHSLPFVSAGLLQMGKLRL